MRIIADAPNQTSTQRIGNDIARRRNDTLIPAQRMIVKPTLPDRTPQRKAYTCLDPPNRFTETHAFIQLHQPMHMIRHHNKSEGFGYGNNSRRMHCPDHMACRKKIFENSGSTSAYQRKQIDLPSLRKTPTA
jgi:hypothetical protein